MVKVLILALCINWTRGQNVDDAIRDLYMKIDSLEQENMEIHRELDFLENEVTGRAYLLTFRTHPYKMDLIISIIFSVKTSVVSHLERYEKSNLKS